MYREVWFRYWWLLVPAVVLRLVAQSMVRDTYRKYGQSGSITAISGAEIACRIDRWRTHRPLRPAFRDTPALPGDLQRNTPQGESSGLSMNSR